jgi:predicted transport protein
MPIFRIAGGQLKKLNALPLAKEKELQKLIEDNLKEVLDLQFLATEYTTTFGGRIDTLAVDAGGAPVIIEYKRNKNDNVINQALSYLKWLKTQKPGFFEKLMSDKLGDSVAKSIGLDWSNPRVICIAESYNKFDIDTVEVVPLRIELLRYRYHEDSVFSLEPVNVGEPVSVAVSSPQQPGAVGTVTAVASVDALLAKADSHIAELFKDLRARILEISQAIEEKATSFYVAYKVSNNFAEVHIGKGQLKIHLRPLDYPDPLGKVEKIPDGYNWTMNRRIYLKTQQELDYVMEIIEQSLNDVL